MVAGAKHQADIHASQVLSAVADIAAVAQDADVLQVAVEHAAVALALLHSLTLVVVAAAVVATVQTSAGIVTLGTQAVTAVADQLDLTIVQHTVQVAEVEQVLRAKAPTAPVAIPEHLGHTKLVQVVVVVQAVKVEFLENHGVTDKVTATTVAETMELVVVDQVHHMVVDLEAKAQCVLFGQQLEDATHRAVLKIKDGEF